VQKISSEGDRVLFRTNGVDPSGRDEQGAAGRQLDPEAIVDSFPEKFLSLKKMFCVTTLQKNILKCNSLWPNKKKIIHDKQGNQEQILNYRIKQNIRYY
jgi:hypothetical protein